MNALAVVLVLLGISALFSLGVVIGAWLSWCSYEDWFRDGLRLRGRR